MCRGRCCWRCWRRLGCCDGGGSGGGGSSMCCRRAAACSPPRTMSGLACSLNSTPLSVSVVAPRSMGSPATHPAPPGTHPVIPPVTGTPPSWNSRSPGPQLMRSPTRPNPAPAPAAGPATSCSSLLSDARPPCPAPAAAPLGSSACPCTTRCLPRSPVKLPLVKRSSGSRWAARKASKSRLALGWGRALTRGVSNSIRRPQKPGAAADGAGAAESELDKHTTSILLW